MNSPIGTPPQQGQPPQHLEHHSLPETLHGGQEGALNEHGKRPLEESLGLLLENDWKRRRTEREEDAMQRNQEFAQMMEKMMAQRNKEFAEIMEKNNAERKQNSAERKQEFAQMMAQHKQEFAQMMAQHKQQFDVVVNTLQPKCWSSGPMNEMHRSPILPLPYYPVCLQTILDMTLQSDEKRHSRLLISGSPGTGKSTLLVFLFRTALTLSTAPPGTSTAPPGTPPGTSTAPPGMSTAPPVSTISAPNTITAAIGTAPVLARQIVENVESIVYVSSSMVYVASKTDNDAFQVYNADMRSHYVLSDVMPASCKVVLVLFDGDESITGSVLYHILLHLPAEAAVVSVLAASADRGGYKFFCKEDHTTVFCGPLREDEIKYVGVTCLGLPAGSLDDRWLHSGGILRSFKNKIESTKFHIKSEVKQLEAAKGAFDIWPSRSHFAPHLFVQYPDENGSYYVGYASAVAQEECTIVLAQRFSEGMAAESLRLALGYCTRDVIGRQFEAYAIAVLQKGKEMTLHNLTDNNTMRNLNFQPTQKWNVFQQDTKSLPLDTLLVPVASNFTLFDALYVTTSDVWMLQMTVAETHETTVQKVNTVVSSLQQRVSSSTPNIRYHMVWVGCGKDGVRKPQLSKLSLPPSLPHIDEWAMFLNLGNDSVDVSIKNATNATRWHICLSANMPIAGTVTKKREAAKYYLEEQLFPSNATYTIHVQGQLSVKLK